jgi:hypothetical protein
MKKEVRTGLIQQGENYFTLNWKKLSFFSILFFSILFIDVLFISYFLFNYFFIVHEEPKVNFCLYDSYVQFLEKNEIINTDELCNGFFLKFENYDKCNQFEGLSDYCKLIFMEDNKYTFFNCDDFIELNNKEKCEYHNVEISLNDVGFIESFGGEKIA